MSRYSTHKGTIISPIRQKLSFFLRKRDFIHLVLVICAIFEINLEDTGIRFEKYLSKLNISRSFISISEINLEDTGIRFEKYPSKLDISRSFISIFVYVFIKMYSCMKTLEKIYADKLLKIKAIKLQPSNPFTWASGWKSPFYCDNRKTLSYPGLRDFIKIEFARVVQERFGQVDAIAGVATGAIAMGALVADLLNLPFVYVRSSPKDHGLENLIEGDLRPGMKVVVVEDLISTGGSSLKAVQAIRNNGCEVIGMVASYTYGFDVAEKAFKEADVELITLTNYEAVLEVALETGYITEDELPLLNDWRRDPSHWNQ